MVLVVLAVGPGSTGAGGTEGALDTVVAGLLATSSAGAVRGSGPPLGPPHPLTASTANNTPNHRRTRQRCHMPSGYAGSNTSEYR